MNNSENKTQVSAFARIAAKDRAEEIADLVAQVREELALQHLPVVTEGVDMAVGPIVAKEGRYLVQLLGPAPGRALLVHDIENLVHSSMDIGDLVAINYLGYHSLEPLGAIAKGGHSLVFDESVDSIMTWASSFKSERKVVVDLLHGESGDEIVVSQRHDDGELQPIGIKRISGFSEEETVMLARSVIRSLQAMNVVAEYSMPTIPASEEDERRRENAYVGYIAVDGQQIKIQFAAPADASVEDQRAALIQTLSQHPDVNFDIASIGDNDLNFVDSLNRARNDEELVVEEGGAAQAFIMSKPEPLEIFKADVAHLRRKHVWGIDFARALVHSIREEFSDLVVEMIDGTKNFILMAGPAKQVGIARDVFADTLSMIGIKMAWDGFKHEVEHAVMPDEKFKEYGINLAFEEGRDYPNFMLETIDAMPQLHKADALRVALDNIAADMTTLVRVRNHVAEQLRLEPEYDKVRRLTDKFGVSEESLYHILQVTASGKKLDPDGSVLRTLESNHNLLKKSDEFNMLYGEAIKAIVVEAMRIGNPSMDEIQERLKRKGLDPEKILPEPVRPPGTISHLRAVG